MHYTYNVTWKGIPVGEITDLEQDMWNMNGKWHGFEIPECKEFENLLLNFNMATFAKDPDANAIKVVLFETQHADRKIYCLATSIENNEISLRQLVSEEALNMFFPNRMQ